MKLVTALREKLKFDAKPVPYKTFPIRMMQNPDIPERDERLDLINDYLDQGMKFLNLQPTLNILLEVVLFAEESNKQIMAQKVMWPAEVDHLDDALNKLREHLKLEPK